MAYNSYIRYVLIDNNVISKASENNFRLLVVKVLRCQKLYVDF